MLYYNFGNYEGFKELFGVVRHDNGAKSRRNKILLSFIKQRKLIAAKMKDHAETIDHLVWQLIDIVESTEKQFINTSDQRNKDVIYCYVYHDGFDELREMRCNGIALMDGVLCVLPTEYQNEFLTDEEALESTDWLSFDSGYVFETPTILSIAESIEEYVK